MRNVLLRWRSGLVNLAILRGDEPKQKNIVAQANDAVPGKRILAKEMASMKTMRFQGAGVGDEALGGSRMARYAVEGVCYGFGALVVAAFVLLVAGLLGA